MSATLFALLAVSTEASVAARGALMRPAMRHAPLSTSRLLASTRAPRLMMAEQRDWDGALRELNARMNVSSVNATQLDVPVEEPAYAVGELNTKVVAIKANATQLTALAEEPVYRVASSRERLDDSKKNYVDSMNEREEKLVNTWGSEKGLLGAMVVVGVVLCFYIWVGLSGGLDHPRPDVLYVDPSLQTGYEEGERLLQSTR
ncbi:hypothetical protein T492DRAFT_959630 [Pavlovales sp. CCMP2436]|nr:hypothetical protein T492DRAFT_959630 [Pavlovales sp. CCMP2436]|mmetsp:Transcript_16045/g.40888  ORF Transcript_16045/g.40888 Transcript_16045/m.40888 type:complete len:203 (+) Transcript_16045:37-645(+)